MNDYLAVDEQLKQRKDRTPGIYSELTQKSNVL